MTTHDSQQITSEIKTNRVRTESSFIAYIYEQYFKPGTCIQVQIQKTSICENVSMTSDLFVVSHCVHLVLQKKTRKNKNPYSKGFYIHSAEMNQGYSIFIGKDWPIVPFSPVALHVYHVFPIVFVVFTKELQNCAVVQPDQSGIMLLGSKRIRHQTGRTVFINIPGIIGC